MTNLQKIVARDSRTLAEMSSQLSIFFWAYFPEATVAEQVIASLAHAAVKIQRATPDSIKARAAMFEEAAHLFATMARQSVEEMK